MDLFQLLISLIVVGLVCYLLWWLIAYVGLPEPFNKVARVIIALFAVLFLLGVLTGNVSMPVFKLR